MSVLVWYRTGTDLHFMSLLAPKSTKKWSMDTITLFLNLPQQILNHSCQQCNTVLSSDARKVKNVYIFCNTKFWPLLCTTILGLMSDPFYPHSLCTI